MLGRGAPRERSWRTRSGPSPYTSAWRRNSRTSIRRGDVEIAKTARQQLSHPRRKHAVGNQAARIQQGHRDQGVHEGAAVQRQAAGIRSAMISPTRTDSPWSRRTAASRSASAIACTGNISLDDVAGGARLAAGDCRPARFASRMSRLILVRHGESSGNRERIFAIQPHELPLTELGYCTGASGRAPHRAAVSSQAGGHERLCARQRDRAHHCRRARRTARSRSQSARARDRRASGQAIRFISAGRRTTIRRGRGRGNPRAARATRRCRRASARFLIAWRRRMPARTSSWSATAGVMMTLWAYVARDVGGSACAAQLRHGPDRARSARGIRGR